MNKITSFIGTYYQRYNLKDHEDFSDLVNINRECHVDIYTNKMTIANTENPSELDRANYPASEIEADLLIDEKKILFIFPLTDYILTLRLDRDIDVEVYRFKLKSLEEGRRVIKELNNFKKRFS